MLFQMLRYHKLNKYFGNILQGHNNTCLLLAISSEKEVFLLASVYIRHKHYTYYNTYSSLSLLRYTAGIRKKYHNIQTIEISSINCECFVIVGILIWYHNKQHLELSDIMIMRDHYKYFT